jgi:anti-sigma regulatory factor (Ser/Thr protein kinase)
MVRSGIHTHQALFYRDDGQYLEGLSRFLGPSVAANEPVVLALPPSKLQLVRERLSIVSVDTLLDMSEVGLNPGRLLAVIEQMCEKHRGRTVHYVGEPIWPGRSSDEIREAIRHEALVNAALRDTPTRICCPYDAGQLDGHVLASAKRTHPEILDEDETRPSCCYKQEIPPECELRLSAAPPDALSFQLKEGVLGDIRAAIRIQAHDAGWRADLVDDLQIVACELATNALRHGAPRRRLTLWRTPRKVICQVENRGAISDPLAGRHRLRPDAEQGMGLWIVHQISDLVETRDGTDTTIRAHLAT